MEDATVNNEKEKKKKKKKSKKKKKKKKTKDDGVTPGGPMVEATDSTNATAATQGVHVGTETNIYNTRLPDVPIEYYYSEEAKPEGLKAEAEWVAEQEARSSTTTTPTTTNNNNNGDGHNISGDEGNRNNGPGFDRDQDNDPQASMEAIMHNIIFVRINNRRINK